MLGTSGFVKHAGRISKKSDDLVAALEGNGALVCGKTNVPEFGCVEANHT